MTLGCGRKPGENPPRHRQNMQISDWNYKWYRNSWYWSNFACLCCIYPSEAQTSGAINLMSHAVTGSNSQQLCFNTFSSWTDHQGQQTPLSYSVRKKQQKINGCIYLLPSQTICGLRTGKWCPQQWKLQHGAVKTLKKRLKEALMSSPWIYLTAFCLITWNR